MRKIFFIQSFDSFDHDGHYADLHLSDYNFEKLKEINKLSQLRWATLIDGVLEPGKGTGIIKIGQYTFTVTYAWGGRGKPDAKSWNDRTSYTTRISTIGDDVQHLKSIMNQMIIDECGALTKDIAFRKFHKDLNGPVAYRKRLEKHNTEILGLKKKYANAGGWKDIRVFSKKQISEAVGRFTKNWKDPNAVVTIHNFMRNIETDMLR